MAEKPTYEELVKRIQELEKKESEFKLSQEKLHESEENYRNLINKLDDIIWTLDLNLRTTYVSPSIEKKLGFTPEERIAQDPSAQMTPSSYAHVTEFLAQELSGEKGGLAAPNRTVRVEVELYHKNGSTLWTENVISGLRDKNGILIGIHGVSRDINDRKETEEVLRESGKKYKLLAENSADVIYKLNIGNEQCTYASPSIEGLLGYTVEESLSLSAQDFLTKESYLKQRERLINSIENGGIDPETMELEAIHKNGHLIPIEIKASFISDEQGRPLEILGIARDITERKHAEKELKESEERYKELFERSLDCVYTHDFEGNFISANQTALDLFGYTKEEIKSLNFASILSEDELLKAFNALREIIKKGVQDGISEYKVKNKNGDYLHIETTGALIYKDGKPHAIMGTARDITERKRAEKALRESEIKHKTLVNNIPGMIYRTYPDWSAEFISSSEAICGYTKKELTSKEDNWLSIIHPDDKEKVFKEGSELTKAQKDIVQTYRIRTKDGHIRWVEDRKISIFSEKGNFLGIDGVVFDITKRKQTEYELNESEERLKDFINSATDSFVFFDSELNIIKVSKAHMEMFHPEMDQEDLIGKNLLEIVPNLKETGRFDDFMKVIKTGIPFYSDDIVPHQKFGNRYLSVKAFKMTEGLGTITVDITKQKQTERALFESKEWHKNFLENLSDVVYEADDSGNITYANKIAESITGVLVKDIIGKPFLPFFDKKSQKIAIDVYLRTLNGESPEYELTFNNGRIAYFKNKPRRNKDGKTIGVFGIARDVTELKIAEEALRTVNERLEKQVKERTAELEERNIALKVLLDQRKNDKERLEKTIMVNIKKLIKPNLIRLKKSSLNDRQRSELAILEGNLSEIISPFESSLSSEYLKLTPSEIQVANFIKHGATSKEIASSLGLSRRTIDVHRHNIREKIGIRGKGVNLRSYLSSLA